MNPIRVFALTGLALAALGGSAQAIPAFARAHRVSCSQCHDPFPRLNPFGENFAGNGFRFASEQPPPDQMATGDPLLWLPDRLRLAMRLDAYATAYTSGEATDFQTPYNLKILSGGPLSRHLSYYLYFLLFERGEIGGVEDAFVTWNDLAGAPVDISVGQFQVSDPMFKRELRLEYQDYAIFRARIGNTPADLTYDRGLVVSAEVAGFTFTGQLVNGNGRGEAGASRRFDDDKHKSFIGHIQRDVANGVTLGALGYLARQEGGVADAPAALNKLWMLGANTTVDVGEWQLNAQYIHRVDASPTFTVGEASAVTNGGFAEVIWHPTGSRWYGVALYNMVETNRPLLDVGLGGAMGITRYQALTGGFGYLVQRNVRVYTEGTWDRELGATQWTVGLTTAF